MNRTELFREAVTQWGVDAQVALAIEEMAELTKELCKLKRQDYSYTAQSIQPLIKELADVLIMLDQIAYTFDINTDIVYEDNLKHLAKLLEGTGDRQ